MTCDDESYENQNNEKLCYIQEDEKVLVVMFEQAYTVVRFYIGGDDIPKAWSTISLVL